MKTICSLVDHGCKMYARYNCRMWDKISDFFFFQAEDGIRDLVRSRGLGDVYKRQGNVLIKTAEGVGKLIRTILVEEITASPVSKLGGLLSLIHI